MFRDVINAPLSGRGAGKIVVYLTTVFTEHPRTHHTEGLSGKLR